MIIKIALWGRIRLKVTQGHPRIQTQDLCIQLCKTEFYITIIPIFCAHDREYSGFPQRLIHKTWTWDCLTLSTMINLYRAHKQAQHFRKSILLNSAGCRRSLQTPKDKSSAINMLDTLEEQRWPVPRSLQSTRKLTSSRKRGNRGSVTRVGRYYELSELKLTKAKQEPYVTLILTDLWQQKLLWTRDHKRLVNGFF